MGWRGRGGPYLNVDPARGEAGGGGGMWYSALKPGRMAVIEPGDYATGGGRRQSTAAPLAGYGGVGGPGPGALIGLSE